MRERVKTDKRVSTILKSKSKKNECQLKKKKEIQKPSPMPESTQAEIGICGKGKS